MHHMPITPEEEQAAKAAGDALCTIGQALMRQGATPNRAEEIVLAVMSGRSSAPASGLADAAEAGLDEMVRAALTTLPEADAALAIATFLAEFMPHRRTDYGVPLPAELLWLMDALGGQSEDEDSLAYCPFPGSLQASLVATRRYARVLHAAPVPTPSCTALAGLFPNWTAQPYPLLDETAPVPQCDTLLCAPPLALRIQPARQLRAVPLAARRTSDGEMAHLDDLLTCTARRVVTLASWGLLASERPLETMFKHHLLTRGVLEALVQLPNTLIPGTRWNPALLVLDHTRDRETPVRLIDATDGFHDLLKGRGTQARLTGWRDIFAAVCGAKNARARHMGSLALLDADCDISPRRHVGATRHTNGSGGTTTPLGKLATIMRGQVWPGSTVLVDDETPPNGEVFREVAISDIGADGILRRPEKRRHAPAPIEDAQRRQILRPGDILLSCKGAVGKVVLVPEDCGSDWILSQSFQVLRVAECVDPICLFHQLRTPPLRNYMVQRTTGGTVPQLKTADIRTMPIPTLAEGEQDAMRARHAELLALNREIEKLEQQKRTLLLQLEG